MHDTLENRAAQSVAYQTAQRAIALSRKAQGFTVRETYDAERGGWVVDAPIETLDEAKARLAEQDARAAAFRASPLGRFYDAIEAIRADDPALGERLYGIYSRSMRMADTVAPAIVGECLQLLAPVDTRAAQDAELALADMLLAFKAAA